MRRRRWKLTSQRCSRAASDAHTHVARWHVAVSLLGQIRGTRRFPSGRFTSVRHLTSPMSSADGAFAADLARLQSMGFDQAQSTMALKKNGTVDRAIDWSEQSTQRTGTRRVKRISPLHLIRCSVLPCALGCYPLKAKPRQPCEATSLYRRTSLQSPCSNPRRRNPSHIRIRIHPFSLIASYIELPYLLSPPLPWSPRPPLPCPALPPPPL